MKTDTYPQLLHRIHEAVERAYASGLAHTIVTSGDALLTIHGPDEIAVLRENADRAASFTPVLTAYPDGHFDFYHASLPREVVHV